MQERLEREFQIDLITTAPSVRYHVTTTAGELLEVDSPSRFPDPSEIREIEEPIIEATVITREDSIGEILTLLEEKRGEQKKFEYIGSGRVLLVYQMPLNEIVLDFYDRLKSASRGYASLDYHLAGYRVSPMVKLDVLVAGDQVDALSMIVHRDLAYERGKLLIEKLRKLIPRQMFEVALQAAIGNKIVARENIAGMRKNVLAKCYGGDISRKRKLLEKQKEGKRRMKRVGKVRYPAGGFPGGAQSKRGRLLGTDFPRRRSTSLSASGLRATDTRCAGVPSNREPKPPLSAAGAPNARESMRSRSPPSANSRRSTQTPVREPHRMLPREVAEEQSNVRKRPSGRHSPSSRTRTGASLVTQLASSYSPPDYFPVGGTAAQVPTRVRI